MHVTTSMLAINVINWINFPHWHTKGLYHLPRTIKGPNAMSSIHGTAHLRRPLSQWISHKRCTSSPLSSSTSLSLYIRVTHHTPRAGGACDLRLGLGEARRGEVEVEVRRLSEARPIRSPGQGREVSAGGGRDEVSSGRRRGRGAHDLITWAGRRRVEVVTVFTCWPEEASLSSRCNR
jgi:hypothetical protein